MHTELAGGEAALRQRFNTPLDDASGGSAPTGMQQCDGSRRVGNEDRDAVGDRDGECEPTLGSDVTIRSVHAEPPFPSVTVNHDARAVHLIGGRQSSTIWR